MPSRATDSGMFSHSLEVKNEAITAPAGQQQPQLPSDDVRPAHMGVETATLESSASGSTPQ
eukprot:2027176-Prymnesium_polylepis.1